MKAPQIARRCASTRATSATHRNRGRRGSPPLSADRFLAFSRSSCFFHPKAYLFIYCLKQQCGICETGFKKKVPGRFGVSSIKAGVEEPLREPDEIYYMFHLEGLTPKIAGAIEAAGTDNIHELAARCYKTLSEYYEFYKAQLEANRNR